MWDRQVEDLVNAGCRVTAYDRRGFGLSDFPWNNYGYDQLAEDLRSIIIELNLYDVTLVGFSMGGGEVVRYFTKYSDNRISQAVLISSIIPLETQKADNPKGVPLENLNDNARQCVGSWKLGGSELHRSKIWDNSKVFMQHCSWLYVLLL